MNFQDFLGVGARFLMPQQVAQQQQAEEAERLRKQRMDAARASSAMALTPQGPAPFLRLANAAAMPGMAAHSAAVNQVNDAISAEMQSRVSQEREARRMQHEKDLLLKRIQGMNGRQQSPMGDDYQAALAVLQAEDAAGRTGTVRNNALRKLGML